ncbi:nucleosome assembly protein 1-like 1 isoform X2 [Mustela nigripes]|uniref:Nucleosome assembly protein 1-like 1 isoform X2 n=1 Tax=Mustela putorius furo TaxID=9669 RepID=A0A8U0USQ4_MUSPF|nr:nucleosome assembly protein 1-like 1 isoform X2 [Mustela putorius furo]XP_059042351.1 nucleosome assembly protein 1-like 1 isoform X2 [Mustela lutreola]XP_059258414.1 nucleosome assembly protein 1-like 1 isoform X2 [Mustela nigripes]
MADIDNKEQSELDQDLDDVEEVEEEETGEETKIKARQLTVQMMQNPQILAALQERLDGLVETPTGYIESLPRVVKRRVNALKNLQVKCAQIEAKFYEEVHDLERKYAVLYQPLFDKRFEIINAIYEPTEEECEWKPDEEDEISELKEKAKIEDEKKDEEKEDPKGIPEFWLTVFKNVDLLSDMVQEHDEPILKHLKDIKVKFSDAGQPMSFVLEFHFEPNEYFTNEVLTKTYRMRSEPDDSDPFSFDGPEIMGCTGCQIDWKKGKNVTLKTIKKKQKHKGRGTVRTVTKTVSNDSFFNFFAPPEVPESGDLDDDAEAILAADFEIGHFLRERIIPRSVLYFTGEAIEDDDDDVSESESCAEIICMMKKVKKQMRKGKKKEMRKMIQTMTQRRIKTQQSASSSEAGWSTFCFPGKDEFTSFDKPISSFLLLFVCLFLFLQPKIKMSNIILVLTR